ncbi:hypothetical protein HKD37_18G051208 [Glycine soja]
MNILMAHDQGWEQELSPYNQYEEEKKTPNLESVFEEFMAYHASSKANQSLMKNHEIHFGGQELQPYYQNEAERGSNLDKLLMQFMETTKSTQQALQSVEIQVGELAEAVTQFMSRQKKSFIEAEAQEKSPVKEHESREKDEEQAQQQWENRKPIRKYSPSNNLPHQLIDKKGRQGEHEETLSAILSLITNTFLEMIWNVLPDFMKFMEFLAKRRNFKEDVFFVVSQRALRGQARARLTGALSKGGKMRGVATNVYLWKTSEKPKETGRQKRGFCSYVPSFGEEIRPT